jgi:hypothetical protein
MRRVSLGLALGLVFMPMPSIAAPQGLHALPNSVIGIWGFDAESCAREGDGGQLTIAATSLEFGVSAYELQSIVMRPGGTLRGEGLYREEGYEHASREVIELKLLAPRRLLVRWARNQEHIYVRCDAAG